VLPWLQPICLRAAHADAGVRSLRRHLVADRSKRSPIRVPHHAACEHRPHHARYRKTRGVGHPPPIGKRFQNGPLATARQA
jgi:hypothetical protein